MNRNLGYVKFGVVVLVWGVVLLAGTYRSHTPAIFGRYSWGYGVLLGILVGGALMLSLAPSAWYVKLYQARAGILVSCLSLLLSLGAVELVLRLLDPLGISYYELAGEYMRDKLADDKLIFRHKQSWETHYGNVRVTYNEHGLRDRPILPKREHEYRILALGDSVTFGAGVDQDKTFAARLEPLLQGRLHRPVRVINSGVGGYNTVQEVTYFKLEGINLQPDLVMLTYIGNDIEVNKGPFDPWAASSPWGKPLPDMLKTMLGKLWFYRLIHHSLHFSVPNQLKVQSSNSLENGEGWRRSMSALSELVASCEERKIPLIVFFKRSPGKYDSLLDAVRRSAQGVPVIDMGPWYEGLDESSLVISKIDGHPNEEGHRLIAERMADDLVGYLAQLKIVQAWSGIPVAIAAR